MEKGLTIGIASALSLISGSLVTQSHLEILIWACGGQSGPELAVLSFLGVLLHKPPGLS